MTSTEVARLIGAIIAAYPLYPMPEETTDIYAAMLSDLDYDEAHDALSAHIAVEDRAPAIANIRRRVAAMRVQLPSALDVWSRVYDYGTNPYDRSGFDPPEAYEAFRVLGQGDPRDVIFEDFKVEYARIIEEAVRTLAETRPMPRTLALPPQRQLGT